ncbi:F-BAR domain only protein 1 isoform X1 [Tachysurus fulvidraco]|uniref:F-BAR domain only protein 1 isoform X1 n=2 Tax=Tachysurus fulvidraco TaxID=1234273 RepID=UPI001FF03D40|nr:F-BAR domain only protein 1 isoform X1 [Tachysurus fulvidraco]
METAYFKNNFWGEKNAGFDVLYHNMKHGQIATKELAEFVRERAAIEETYSKSMSKLAKMAGNGSPLGTFAPMWDLFRMSSDKVALCHLELMRKMNDLIRDLNKYSEEQVKVHRKTKEEVMGTLEAIQALHVQNGHLQKAREGYHAKCTDLERLRKEGAPQKELEKAELKSKKVFESFAASVDKFNRAGGDFEQKMSESAQKFQDIEEEHLRKMKQLIKSYSHSIEDTHVQVGQVHEEFKQNVENIGIRSLIQKFTEQKGTGKERPGPVSFEEFLSTQTSDNNKKSRAKAFRIPGLGKKDKEPDFTDSALTDTPNSPLEVDDEGFMIRADVNQNGSTEDKENNFYSSDSDYDDEEPKKFHIQIRPVCSRSNSAANELELKATVGTLTLPLNPAATTKRHISRNISTAGRSEGESDSAPQRDSETAGLCRFTSSPNHSRLSSTASGSDSLFGPPLESAYKSHSFSGREQLQTSEYAAFSSASSSPENVEDSGLDSPSHQPLGASPEPTGWAAWPSSSQPKEPTTSRRLADPFLDRASLPQEWPSSRRSPLAPPRTDSSASSIMFPAFSNSVESSVWSCKHIPQEDPFLAAFEHQPARQDPWVAPPPPRTTQEDPFAPSASSTKTLPPPRERKRSIPPPDSPDDPFAITMIGSPTHQSVLTAQGGEGDLTRPVGSNSAPKLQPKKEATRRGSVHNPFSDVTQEGGRKTSRNGGEKERRSGGEEQRRSRPPLTRLSGPQEDLCFSTDKDQDCLDISEHTGTQRRFSSDLLVLAPPRPARSMRSSSRPSGSERSRSLCSSPLPEPSPPPTSSSSSSSPSDWGGQTRAPSPVRGLSRGPSPISLSTQESWPVAAAFTEYINAYFKGGENNRCLVKITGDLTMSFPAGIIRIFAANPTPPVLSLRLVGIARVDQFLPNQKLLYSDPSQNDPNSKDFWFNMQALTVHLQREAELNPQASYYNVGVLKYQVSSQDPARAPLLLSAECQRSGTVTRVALDYHCCPATAPATQLTAVQVLLPLDPTATDLQCQPPATWNTEDKRLLWKLPHLSPTNHSKGSGTLCASWQCLEEPRGPAPSLAVQFVGTGASLSGLDMELVGGRYRMSLLKKRFATGKYMAGCLL